MGVKKILREKNLCISITEPFAISVILVRNIDQKHSSNAKVESVEYEAKDTVGKRKRSNQSSLPIYQEHNTYI